MNGWEKELQLARESAIAAGDILKSKLHSTIRIISETGKDIKLQDDQDSEKLIVSMLQERSNYAVIAEEHGQYGLLNKGEPCWIVDPLDGTANFSRGLPGSCVSIALWAENEPVAGVVYDFNHKNLYMGLVGKGATLNGAPIHVSEVTNREHAVLTTGFPVHRNYQTDSLTEFIQDIQSFKKIRMFGTAALSLAYVASGCADAYIEADIMLWDVAAGAALVKAAGGYIDVKPSGNKEYAMDVKCGSSEAIFKTHSN